MNKYNETKIIQLEQENQKLKKNLLFYSSLLQNHNDAVIIHDFNGEIIAWDHEAESIFGWKQKDLLSTSIFKIIPENKIEDYKNFIDNIKNNKQPNFFETQKITTKKEIKDIWLTYKVIGGETPYAIATNERDITARKQAAKEIKQSEEKYQTLINSLGDGIILLDKNLNIILSNPATEKILFIKKEILYKTNIQSFLTEKNFRILHKNLSNAKSKITTFELEIIRKDSEKRLLQITLSTPQDGISQQHNRLCILKDITDIRHMEEELIKADKLESLGLLAGGIAHDFNNILSIISGNVTLAQMCIDDKPKLNERLDRISTANERAKQLTHQIATLSKGHTVSKIQISIDTLVRECVSLTLESQKATYELEVEKDLPTIKVDEGQISQILNNLLINATHAIDKLNGKIEINVKEIEIKPDNKFSMISGDYIQILIKDNGCGIPKENLKKIFDPYFTTKDYGTGLGLSTSISIINKHGGKLIVNSKINEGTTFFVYLPIAENDRTSREERLFTTHGKILFMDDEESIRSIADLFFKKLNYKIVLTSHGQETIDIYQNQFENGTPFDFVFLDLKIPDGMDGPTCAKKLLKINPNAKIIAISGDIVMSEYKEQGFVKALKKPFRVAGIQTILKELSS